jgi:Na+-driven multidrug efflux pump
MAAETARFVTGSTMRHVVVMASTGAVGLIAVFAVDLINLFYISLLGQRQIAAAVGFSGVVGFLQSSIAIGMMIGVGAIVSRAIGAGRVGDARRIATGSLVVLAAVMALLAAITLAALQPLLTVLGAAGETRDLAAGFLMVAVPSVPLLAAGMCCSALLRSVGDARRAMNITLLAALATAVLDPILIFALHLGLAGAAITTVLSRCVMAFIGWRSVTRAHDLIGPFSLRDLPADMRRVFAVAGPAVLTNLATPVGAAYVTSSMAMFGSGAVAGQATIDRLSPVAFGLVYALSGTVGPILAQNLGAGRLDRVQEALRNAMLFMVVAVTTAWLLLAAGQSLVVLAFHAEGVTAQLIRLFCSWLAAAFLFNGALFVGNAVFNNLGFPLLSTMFNWGRATLGTIPLVTWGATYGPLGVLTGQAAGSAVFGVAAAATAFHVVRRMDAKASAGHEGALALVGGSGQAALAVVASREETPEQPRPATLDTVTPGR